MFPYPHPELLDLALYELFTYFLDDEFLEYIKAAFNRNAARNNEILNLFPGELKKVIGVMLLSVYHVLPSQHLN